MLPESVGDIYIANPEWLASQILRLNMKTVFNQTKHLNFREKNDYYWAIPQQIIHRLL